MAGIVLNVEKRERTGTGGARATRNAGLIPGVLYGGPKGAVPIEIKAKDVEMALRSGKFLSHMVELNHQGEKQPVIPRAVQLDPVRDFPIHVDFLRLGKDALVTVDVPVRFLNEAASPGLKRGGVLNIVRHDIAVRCPADAIPDHFEVDLTGLEIGDSVHISAVKLPEGVRPTITERDFTVATIVGRAAEEPVPGAPTAEAVEPGAEVAAAAPAEGAEEKEKPKEEKEKKK